MDNNEYLNFDEAVDFLNTTRSTLYKWLQAGKIPGKKLGRQWRFIRAELDEYRKGSGDRQRLSDALQDLESFFNQRKETLMQSSTTEPIASQVAEDLIWDAIEHGASDIHLQPKSDAYELTYRINSKLTSVKDLDLNTFRCLNDYWEQISQPLRNENKRRFFMAKEAGEQRDDVQVRYQKLNTIKGERVTMALFPESHTTIKLEKACSKPEDLQTFKSWCQAPSGIVVLAGKSGSGKTTTLYCCMQEMIAKRYSIFTIEDPVEYIIDGINQVEVDLNDEKAVSDTLQDIFSSDLDVLCLGNSFIAKQNSTLAQTALKTASTGHLVFMTLDCESPDKILDTLNAELGEDIGKYIVGTCWQELVPHSNGKGRMAEYQMQAGPLSPKS